MSNSKERIKRIKEHFENISVEEFEKNMEKAGSYSIKPACESNMRLYTYEELILSEVMEFDNNEEKYLYDESDYEQEANYDLTDWKSYKGWAA